MKRAWAIVPAVIVVFLAGALVELQNRASLSEREQQLDSYAHRDGKREAEADIAAGRPKWKAYGRISDYEIRAALLKEKLGVELDGIAECAVPDSIERFTFEYNTRMKEYLISVYGDPAVFALIGDAPKRFVRSNEEADQSSEPSRLRPAAAQL